MTAHPIDTEGFRGKHQVSDDEWADDIEHLEWALAEAVGRAEAAEHRAIRAEAERDASRKQYDEDIAYWIAATDAAEARIKAVQDIHTPEKHSSRDGDGAICQECLYSDESSVEYPCPTIRALDS